MVVLRHCRAELFKLSLFKKCLMLHRNLSNSSDSFLARERFSW